MGTVEGIRELEERLRQGDSDPAPDTSAVFDELLADDVLFVQGPGNSMGKAGVLKGHQPPRKRTFTKVENREVEVRDLGSTVAVSCRTDYGLQDRAFSLRSLRIRKRVGISWKVTAVALMELPKEKD